MVNERLTKLVVEASSKYQARRLLEAEVRRVTAELDGMVKAMTDGQTRAYGALVALADDTANVGG